jgi:hypothetical protein
MRISESGQNPDLADSAQLVSLLQQFFSYRKIEPVK